MRKIIEMLTKAREEQKAREILINRLANEAEKDLCPLTHLMLAEHGIYL